MCDNNQYETKNKIVYTCNVTDTEIMFKCPYCMTKYKKNGNPTARAKPVIHRHGIGLRSASDKELGFFGTRTAHCDAYGMKKMLEEGYDEFEIRDGSVWT